MTLEILICTLNEGIEQIPAMLLPPSEEISYLVSCQYSELQPVVPSELAERSDVRVTFLKGHGLSRNRNHALAHAVGDILQIADDDELLNMEWEKNVLRFYEEHPNVDIAHFMMQGTSKKYPPSYVSSVEMTFHRLSIERAALHFDERFGLGSDYLLGGEEDVFIHDARKHGMKIQYVPQPLCGITGATTGETFLQDVRMQRTEGAVFCYTRGAWYAYFKCFRESMWWLIHRGANPIPLFYNMCKGIRYV